MLPHAGITICDLDRKHKSILQDQPCPGQIITHILCECLLPHFSSKSF
uniref:Uncharacterized protein n=1 Tax=Arundo donax TaxID=35708 RepID=A0A0A9D6K9_ARUDO